MDYIGFILPDNSLYPIRKDIILNSSPILEQLFNNSGCDKIRAPLGSTEGWIFILRALNGEECEQIPFDVEDIIHQFEIILPQNSACSSDIEFTIPEIYNQNLSDETEKVLNWKQNILFDDGRRFIYNKSTKTAHFYRCHNVKICKAKLEIDIISNNVILSGEHSSQCLPEKYFDDDNLFEKYKSIIQKIVAELSESQSTTKILHNIYSNAENKCNAIISRKTITSLKKKYGPKEVEPMLLANLPKYIKEINFIRFQSQFPYNIIILASSDMIANSKLTTVMLIDGTFKSCPRNFYQLLTIMGKRDDVNIYVPLAHVLLPNKTEACYDFCFSVLQQILSFESVRHFVSDFELGLINSLHKTFIKSNEIRLQCCRFHFVQSLYRRFKKLYRPPYSEGQKLLLKCFQLILFLRKTEREDIYEKLSQKELDINDFLNYFLKNYEHGKFPPEFWECCSKNNTDELSNCALESFHAFLGNKIPNNHPSFEKICTILLNYSQNKQNEIKVRLRSNDRGKIGSKIPCISEIKHLFNTALNLYPNKAIIK